MNSMGDICKRSAICFTTIHKEVDLQWVALEDQYKAVVTVEEGVAPRMAELATQLQDEDGDKRNEALRQLQELMPLWSQKLRTGACDGIAKVVGDHCRIQWADLKSLDECVSTKLPRLPP